MPRRKKELPQSIDKRNSIKVVTDNHFITAKGMQRLSLKARKLLYIAISQVKQQDKEFYEFKITPIEFAELMGIDVSNIYDSAAAICEELQPLGLKCDIGTPEERRTRVYSVFSYCEYGDDSDIKFKLNSDMTRFLLDLHKNFSQPELMDFVKMRSPYSMAIWHLMQREMHSLKPGICDVIEFDLTLQELREATGTESKLKQIKEFKEKVLDKAIREIFDNCSVRIEYTNIKNSRTIVGFHFTARNFIPITYDELSQKTKDKCRWIDLKKFKKERDLTQAEQREFDRLTDTYGWDY